MHEPEPRSGDALDPALLRGALRRAAERTHRRASEPPRTSRDDLVAWARSHLPGRKLLVVSNREPYSHVRQPDGVKVVRNAGGLTVALDAVMQGLGGVWVAHGGGNADRAVTGADGRVPCPPDRPAYTLRRVWLTAEDHEHYYSGFSNGALWPLCHIVYVRPRFRLEDWERYRDVNARFAAATVEEMDDSPAIVFLQDYHLALAAAEIRARRPDVTLATFWHIPWPNAEVFRILPWRREVLEGLLANDVIVFHIRAHALNFLDAVNGTLEARVDLDQMCVDRGGHRTWVRHVPISVPADEIADHATRPGTHTAVAALRRQLGLAEGDVVGLGVDRLDYTKGIPERLEALECLFERHPEWVGRLVFAQIGVPSRIELPEYRAVRSRMRQIAQRINERFPRAEGRTVHVVESNLGFDELIPWYALADFCAVTSLHDGMNLVAKEYVAASADDVGALVLSPFTGAARELERAFIASPYDKEGLAEAMHAALSEEPVARAERMHALRDAVSRRNIYDWAIEVLDTIDHLALRKAPAQPAAATPGEA